MGGGMDNTAIVIYSLGTESNFDVFGSSNRSMLRMLASMDMPKPRITAMISAVKMPIQMPMPKAYSQFSIGSKWVPLTKGCIWREKRTFFAAQIENFMIQRYISSHVQSILQSKVSPTSHSRLSGSRAGWGSNTTCWATQKVPACSSWRFEGLWPSYSLGLRKRRRGSDLTESSWIDLHWRAFCNVKTRGLKKPSTK